MLLLLNSVGLCTTDIEFRNEGISIVYVRAAELTIKRTLLLLADVII